MRVRGAILLLGALLGLAPAAIAGEEGGRTLRILAGGFFPSGAWGAPFRVGLAMSVRGEIPVGRGWAVGGDATWLHLRGDPVAEAWIRILAAQGAVRYDLPIGRPALRPYLAAGGGVAWTELSVGNGGEVSTDPILFAGGGLQRPLRGGVALWVEAGWRRVAVGEGAAGGYVQPGISVGF